MDDSSVTIAHEDEHISIHNNLFKIFDIFVKDKLNMDENKKEDDVDIDISAAYNEKIWGKGSGKENIADGYVFRGRKLFEKAVDGLRKAFIKGSKGKINGVDFRSLDTRKIGSELTIEVVVDNGKQRGIGLLKL